MESDAESIWVENKWSDTRKASDFILSNDNLDASRTLPAVIRFMGTNFHQIQGTYDFKYNEKGPSAFY